MEPALPDGLPNDVLIVEDDPIIALDFEDTILGFGVKIVRCAGSVAHALMMIGERAPDFALLDVGLVREKSFEVAEKLAALENPVRLCHRLWRRSRGCSLRGPAASAKTLFERSAACGAAAFQRSSAIVI